MMCFMRKSAKISPDFLNNLRQKGWVVGKDGGLTAPDQSLSKTAQKAPPPEIAKISSAPPKKPKMKKTESAFLERFIKPAKARGEIANWRFEGARLRLAADSTYCADFMVTRNDGHVEFYEIKGAHIWEDAIVKFKWAREEYKEFTFFMAQFTKKTGWRLKYQQASVVGSVFQVDACQNPALGV